PAPGISRSMTYFGIVLPPLVECSRVRTRRRFLRPLKRQWISLPAGFARRLLHNQLPASRVHPRGHDSRAKLLDRQHVQLAGRFPDVGSEALEQRRPNRRLDAAFGAHEIPLGLDGDNLAALLIEDAMVSFRILWRLEVLRSHSWRSLTLIVPVDHALGLRPGEAHVESECDLRTPIDPDMTGPIVELLQL